MKKRITLLSTLLLLLFSLNIAQAQINILDRAKRKLEDRANRQIDKKIDEALDGKPKQEASENNKDNASSTTASKSPSSPMQSYAKYDFRPGSHVIFEDDFRKEKSDEIPSKWIIKGGNIETTKMDGQVVMGALNGQASFSPRLDKTNYLTENFTIEFDMMYYRYAEYSYYDNDGISIKFCDEGSCPQIGELSNDIFIHNYGHTQFKTFDGKPGGGAYNKVWRHFALAVNEKSVKLYINEERVLNAPLGRGKAYSFSIHTQPLSSSSWQLFFRNFRIATGGAEPYEQIESEGKFVARGINFDYNKTTLRPESMGELNRITEMMKEHEDLKLEIGGHTDSDGDDASNQKLSEKRAEAVYQQLVNMGVESKRLTTKGYGETKPTMDNDTPEGKSNNRRVEFVKQ
jgi:OmpA-OmpF porin, OOP family